MTALNLYWTRDWEGAEHPYPMRVIGLAEDYQTGHVLVATTANSGPVPELRWVSRADLFMYLEAYNAVNGTHWKE